MKIEVGKFYVDRDGDKIQIIRALKGGNFIGVGQRDDGTEYVFEFDKNGEEPMDCYPIKLVEEWIDKYDKEFWISIPENSSFMLPLLFTERDHAERYKDCRVAKVRVVEIDE